FQSMAQTLHFSNDGTKLMYANDSNSAGSSTQTRIWNTSTWQEIRTFTGLGTPVFMPDGNSVLAIEPGTRDVVQLSVSTGAELDRFTVTGVTVDKLIGVRAGGTEFVCTSWDNNQSQRFTVWNMSSNTLAREIEYPSGVWFWSGIPSGDGNRLAGQTWNSIYFYDMSNGQEINTVSLTHERSMAVALAPVTAQFAMQVYDKNALLPP